MQRVLSAQAKRRMCREKQLYRFFSYVACYVGIALARPCKLENLYRRWRWHDDFLFNGPKVTEQIEVVTRFGQNGYRFKLAPTAEENFIINHEASYYKGSASGWYELGSGQTTPELLKGKDERGFLGYRSVAFYIYNAISSWKIYHFHDTSKLAPMRRYETIDDSDYLRFDAANC